MDVRRLEQVLAIHRHGSFVTAAESLGVSQPTLSVSIARLEDQLRMKLFERTPQGAELTAAGEFVVERAERVVGAVRAFRRDAALIAGGDVGQIRIGTVAAQREFLLARLLLRLAKRHPGLGVHVDVGDGAELLRKLEQRVYDVVICGARPEAERDGLVATELLTTDVIFAASPSHPLAKERSIPIERLSAFRSTGAETSQVATAELASLDKGEALGAITTNDFNAIFPLARAGRLILIGSAIGLRPEIEAGSLVRLDVNWNRKMSVVGVTTQTARQAPVLQLVFDYCREIGAELEAELAAHAQFAPADRSVSRSV
jgi:DNA-binding transcriptional LysR family regulator